MTARVLLRDTATALQITQMEGLRERMEFAAANRPVAENPFTFRDTITLWEVVKMCVGVVLAPLKLAGFLFFVMLAAGTLRLGLIGADRSKPLRGWRVGLQSVVNVVFLRLALFSVGLFWINVKGKVSKETRCVIIAPHSTWVDGFTMGYLLSIASPVAKLEAATGNCLMGQLLYSAQAILVDRHSAGGKKDAMDALVNRISSPENWRHVYLFPEGTCTNRKALINFKAGAFVAGKPVQPVLLKWHRNTHFNPVWTSGGPNRLWLIFRFLCQTHVKIDVEFLPPYVPNAEEQSNANVYANAVRQVMATNLGVPVTEHSYEDSFLAALAHKQKLGHETTLPQEFAQLKTLYNITYPQAKSLLVRFAKVNTNKSNLIGLNEFAKLLGLPLTEPVVDFFYYLDVHSVGKIDYPAFLIGLSFLSQQTSLEDTAKVVWLALGNEDLGAKVELSKLAAALDLAFKRGRSARPLPLFREHKSSTITYGEFVSALKLHPEYLPVALRFVEQEDEADRKRFSLRTAQSTLTEKQQVEKHTLTLESYQAPNSANPPDLVEQLEDSLA